MNRDALELDRHLAEAQLSGNKAAIDAARDAIFARQQKIGFLDIEELAGPEESPEGGDDV